MYKIITMGLVFVISYNICNASYYEILGVSKQASTAEIRQAFKKLAIKLHPDKNSNEDEQERFIKITEAYETLKDPEKRHQYDIFGAHSAYTQKYNYHSQSEYNDLFMKGLYHRDAHVETITPSSYKTFLTSGLHFINFYSPFCPPCQNLADDWKKLAEVYKGIVKVGAVNCKYHNTFCYHSMRIGNYPSLYFYPNGIKGSFIQYTGQHSFEDLEKFVLLYIKKKVTLPFVKAIKESDSPIAYVLDTDMNENMLLRIAYRLFWVTNVVKIDDNLKNKLKRDLETTIVLKYNNRTIWINSTDEQTIVKNIVDSLPNVEQVGLKKIQEIRSQLRNGDKRPWVLYFSTKGDDKLLLYHLKVNMPEMMFGEINCDKYGELCHSLQVNKAPAWGILKPGGGYQRLFGEPSQDALEKAAAAFNMHTLSASDFKKILEDDTTWVLLVAPHQTQWQHMMDTFIEASLEFRDAGISFGIISCSKHTDDYCRSVSGNTALIAVQERGKLHRYRGEIDKSDIVEFIDLIKDIDDFSLSEQQVLEITDVWSREHSWVIAFLPRHCDRLCDELLHEMRIVSKRLRPLKFLRVGALRCEKEPQSGFCNNVRAPTLRVYPLASGRHFTIPLQHVSKAPYILEWALNHIDDSIVKLNTHTFHQTKQSDSKKPWVVYFHSPRCYKCYEMYTDFAIIAHHLNNVINFGKVNCISERQICQQEYINSYPSMRIYLNENDRQPYRAVVNLQLSSYSQLWNDLQPHLRDYNDEILAKFETFDIKSHYLRDEL